MTMEDLEFSIQGYKPLREHQNLISQKYSNGKMYVMWWHCMPEPLYDVGQIMKTKRLFVFDKKKKPFFKSASPYLSRKPLKINMNQLSESYDILKN